MKTKYTVKLLKKFLDKYPDNTPVLVSGCESGYDNINSIVVEEVKCVADEYSYEGMFQDVGHDEKGCMVLVLSRDYLIGCKERGVIK